MSTFIELFARVRPATSRALVAAAVGTLTVGGPLSAQTPAADSGIVEITDLPPKEAAPAESPKESTKADRPKVKLPKSRSRIADAFLLRGEQASPRIEEPANEPIWFDPLTDLPPSSTPRKVDSDVQQALRVEPADTSPSRAATILLKAREIALQARTAGDFTDVIDQCHRALDAGPDRKTAEALARLGAWAYNRRGEQLVRSDERAAFDDFQEAILLDPSCWEAFHNRGVTLARYGKLELAIADFDAVLKLEPEFPLARFNRAEACSQLGRWERAIIDYTAALKQLDDEPLAYAGRGHAHHQSGDLREALADYEQALTIDGGCEKALVGRAQVKADQKLYAEAAADFRQALQTGTPTATTYRAVGWFLANCPDPAHRDPAKALEAARRALALSGENDPAALDVMAAACAAAGRFDEAVAHQERALANALEAEKGEYEARLETYRESQSRRAPRR